MRSAQCCHAAVSAELVPERIVHLWNAVGDDGPAVLLDAAVIRIDDLEIDRDRYEVRRQVDGGTRVLRLPRKEFELLYYLASRPGKVFSRARLLDDVWGPDVYVVDRTVDVHVRKIREKIGAERIETIKGVGYRFRG